MTHNIVTLYIYLFQIETSENPTEFKVKPLLRLNSTFNYISRVCQKPWHHSSKTTSKLNKLCLFIFTIYLEIQPNFNCILTNDLRLFHEGFTCSWKKYLDERRKCLWFLTSIFDKSLIEFTWEPWTILNVLFASNTLIHLWNKNDLRNRSWAFRF